MKVVTLLNEKGGVGKTTLATHLAAGLATRGHKVVLVDADPQGNATSGLGIAPAPRFYDLCVRKAAWKDVLTIISPEVYAEPGKKPGLLALVANNIEGRTIALSMDKQIRIRERFSQLHHDVDYIVVDTSPTPSLLQEAILMASDHVLLPTDCEAYSAYESLPTTLEHVSYLHQEAAKKGVIVAQPLGIIPNKRRHTMTHDTVMADLEKLHGNMLWEALPLNTKLTEAQMIQQTLYAVYPTEQITGMMWDIVERVEVGVHAN